MVTSVFSAADKKTNMTPKAIIFQKFSSKAHYKIEEVQEPTQSSCPGLAIPQKKPTHYRCTLELPEFSVISDIFKKKKDAEQSAAEMALKKLGINSADSNLIEQDPWDALVDRLRFIFSDEFLQSSHPLTGHLKGALQRGTHLYGSIPASAIAVCDSKSKSLFKLIDSKVESNPLLALSFVMRAAMRLSTSLVSTSVGSLSIWKRNPYPLDILKSMNVQECDSPVSIMVEAVYIPSSLDKIVRPLALSIPSYRYYVDVIAENLGTADANNLLLSRVIGKASLETRLHFIAPQSFLSIPPSDTLNGTEASEMSFNARASFLCCQHVYGDAIMASIGYTWRSKDLFHEDVSVQAYHRNFISKIPSGCYKLSREAILAAELPRVFTTRTNWRGSFPREILSTFCRQLWLSDPLFETTIVPSKTSLNLSQSHKLKGMVEGETAKEFENGGGTATDERKSEDLGDSFTCKLKVLSKCQNLIIECSPKEIYRRQSDAIFNASLRVLSWLNSYFLDQHMSSDKLNSLADFLDIRFYPENFVREFSLFPPLHIFQHGETHGRKLLEGENIQSMQTLSTEGVCSLNIEGLDTGVYPFSGSLVSIEYSVSLVTEGGCIKELLERNKEFEFEMGTGAVISSLEAAVTQMSVGQSASFRTVLPPKEFIFAAADDPKMIDLLMSSYDCFLEYTVTLLEITAPPEERMEQALFSPPLSKQRVEYALQYIRKCCAKKLVDFGCGSGSLLGSLLDYPTSLEEIVGIDISQKSLSRAAKVLHSKLSEMSDSGIKSAVLYDGSILEFDSRLCGYDIGTCIEVIEHMEEEQASLFGDIALRYFRPKILIVSTPNHEYNVVLHRLSGTSQEEDPDDKLNLSSSSRFRNHDHKFEWTREQFKQWAIGLADRHKYSVEFSGVGGSGDVEPGFASQIAVFERWGVAEDEEEPPNVEENLSENCKVIWGWEREAVNTKYNNNNWVEDESSF